MNELVWPGHRLGTDGRHQVSEPANMQLRDAFCAFNKLILWNRMAFGRKVVRKLCDQIAREFAQVTSPVLIRQAVIMAESKGASALPCSPSYPKPLMPFGDMLILELLLRRMKAVGIQEVILAVNHPRHLIEEYFGDGTKLGLRLYYSGEGGPLGAAGMLGNMLDLLDETFFLTKGDLLTTIDLRRMALNHIFERADASIGVYEREKKIDFGLIEFDANKRLSAYRRRNP